MISGRNKIIIYFLNSVRHENLILFFFFFISKFIYVHLTYMWCDAIIHVNTYIISYHVIQLNNYMNTKGKKKIFFFTWYIYDIYLFFMINTCLFIKYINYINEVTHNSSNQQKQQQNKHHHREIIKIDKFLKFPYEFFRYDDDDLWSK